MMTCWVETIVAQASTPQENQLTLSNNFLQPVTCSLNEAPYNFWRSTQTCQNITNCPGKGLLIKRLSSFAGSFSTLSVDCCKLVMRNRVMQTKVDQFLPPAIYWSLQRTNLIFVCLFDSLFD